MFDGFESRRVRTTDAEIFFVAGGAGPPLLLLHGYPQSHAMWHLVAPQLAKNFFVVAPDLRGYGDSLGPPPDKKHDNYSKRAMARDLVEIMAVLGHERFAIAGHDRGGRVAYRLALDQPEKLTQLALLDLLPTLDVWEAIHGANALQSWHWLLLAQPAPFPEQLIGADPERFLLHVLSRWTDRPELLKPVALAEYRRHFASPSVIQAACEDYRAGATADLEQDRADRAAARKIRCPVLLVWSRRFLGKQTAAPRDVWRHWADDLRDVALDCGHFIAEEQPAACASTLTEFFAARG